MPGLLPPFLRGDVRPHWLYARWVRGVPWAATIDRLKSYSIYVTVITMVIVVSGGIVGYNSGAEEATIMIILGVAGFSFVIVDFASVVFGIATAQEHASQFDLLHMSPILPEDLTQTLHHVTVTRAWRVLVFMQAIRFGLVALLFTVGIGLVGMTVVFTFGTGMLWIAAMVVLALGEPVWRVQLTSAIGVMAGVTVEGTLAQWGAGFGFVLLLWLAQGVVGLVPLAIFVPPISINGSAFAFFGWLTVVLPLMAWGIRYVQRRVCRYCLARTSRHITDPAV